METGHQNKGKISVVVPLYNEALNFGQLHDELTAALSKLGSAYEIIAVNDSSKDNTLEVLKKRAAADDHLKIIHFKYNAGQTAAMSAGIQAATGDIIIPMDGDLQNDPADIPKFIAKMNEGFDVVSGWRRDRKDTLITRKIPSWIANWTIGKITGLKLHDYGCSMKAYRRDAIQEIQLYGEMHRFIPAYAYWRGGKVSEIVVNHRARIHGKTNYGLSRTFRVILDLIVLKFLFRYMNRPMHFFGGAGGISLALGILLGLYACILKLFAIRDFVATPLPVLSALFIIVAVELIGLGIIAEMLMRTYYESQGKKPYSIKEKINFT